MRVFKNSHDFLRLSTFILVIHVVILVLPLADATPTQSQKAHQEVQKHEQKGRLYKRSMALQDIKPQKTTRWFTPQITLPHRLLATKLALGAMLANGAKQVLSGKAALQKKLANAEAMLLYTLIRLSFVFVE